MSNYSEKLKDPRWQKKRLEILNRDGFTCAHCGDSKTELHVHHKEYKRGKAPWDYENSNFQTLCKYCHLIIEHFKPYEVVLCNDSYNKFTNHLNESFEAPQFSVIAIVGIPICYHIAIVENDIVIMYEMPVLSVNSFSEFIDIEAVNNLNL